MSEHTPTPWAITEKSGDGKYTIIDAPSPNDRAEPICSVEHDDVTEASRDEAYANAAFIVKAVNLHKDLVDTLDALLHGGSQYTWDLARILVAKAKGDV